MAAFDSELATYNGTVDPLQGICRVAALLAAIGNAKGRLQAAQYMAEHYAPALLAQAGDPAKVAAQLGALQRDVDRAQAALDRARVILHREQARQADLAQAALAGS